MQSRKIILTYTEEFETVKEIENEIKSIEKQITILEDKKNKLLDNIAYAKNVLGM